jgi:hypothetical protein
MLDVPINVCSSAALSAWKCTINIFSCITHHLVVAPFVLEFLLPPFQAGFQPMCAVLLPPITLQFLEELARTLGETPCQSGDTLHSKRRTTQRTAQARESKAAK